MMLPGCTGSNLLSDESALKWQKFFKDNYRLMTQVEKDETVRRLERLTKLRQGVDIQMSSQGPHKGILFGYAFNISRCEGFMDCVAACVKENNLDRISKTQYIRILEMEQGNINVEFGDGKYFHEVPRERHFYMGVQCFHCENAPCIKACPTKATWREDDGIVVVDYDWCIDCRYCMAACPYWGRRFNWNEPSVPKEELTRKQHYLGKRMRLEARWKNALSVCNGPERGGCRPVSMPVRPVRGSSATCWTRTAKSGSC